MFSRLINSARNIFVRPEAEGPTQQSTEAQTPRKSAKRNGTELKSTRTPLKARTPIGKKDSVRKSASRNAASVARNTRATSPLKQIQTVELAKPVSMVTTRRQSDILTGSRAGTPNGSQNSEVNEDTIPWELLSASARKRRRAKEAEQAEAEGTPTGKRRRLPVRGKKGSETPLKETVGVDVVESKIPDQSQVVVEIPALSQATTVYEDAKEVPEETPKAKTRGRKGKKAEAPGEEPVVEVEDNEEPEAESTAPTPTSTKSKGKKNAKKPEPKAAPVPILPPAAKPKHKKFTDDDPIEVIHEPEAPIAIEDSDEESSDDDAPEEVGAQAAQEKVLAAAREAAKAAEIKEAAARLKRKALDDKLKAQAQAAKKRKHAEETEDSKPSPEAPADGQTTVDSSVTLAESSITLQPSISSSTTSKPRIDRHALPAFLPDSYLDDIEEADEESEDERPVQRQNKKIKFQYNEEKKVKDIKLGNARFRVVEKQVGELAPKSNGNAKRLKEQMLARKGVVRKAVNGGFFSGGAKRR